MRGCKNLGPWAKRDGRADNGPPLDEDSMVRENRPNKMNASLDDDPLTQQGNRVEFHTTPG